MLQTIARGWPRQLWDDLLQVARTRLARRDLAENALWRSPPWLEWATADETIAARVDGFRPRSGPHRPLQAHPTEELLTLLRTGAVDQQRAVLRELNRRGPQPALLAIADELPVTQVYGPLGCAIRLLGARAVPLARVWAQPPEHPMVWTACLVLAEHGDGADLPALSAGWDWLERRAGDLCGYDDLACGIARIGGTAARAAVPRLRRAWFTPHSYERAAYLRAVTTLDPDHAAPLLVEGLWDWSMVEGSRSVVDVRRRWSSCGRSA